MDSKEIIKNQDLERAKHLMDKCQRRWDSFIEAQNKRDSIENTIGHTQIFNDVENAFYDYKMTCVDLHVHLRGSRLLDEIAD